MTSRRSYRCGYCGKDGHSRQYCTLRLRHETSTAPVPKAEATPVQAVAPVPEAAPEADVTRMLP